MHRGSLRRTLIIALVALLLASLVGPVSASVPAGEGSAGLLATATETAFEAEFLALINEERVAEGLGTLSVYSDLVDDARAQAAAIQEAGYLYHNPDLASVTTGWYALGENVGYGPTVQALHDAFMASEGHRANVVKSTYNYGGVGVVLDENQVIWVAIVFMYGPDGLADPVSEPDPLDEIFTPPFKDDDGSSHEPAIKAIADAGVTAGCDAEQALFCPDDEVTRAQMASFLARALDLPAADRDYFPDDTGNAHEAAINSLAAAGLTMGCGNGEYCVDDEVTRAQMATFLMRALDLDGAPTDYFDDDEGSTHQAAINALAFAEITTGCGDRGFCPDDGVTRAQMATFIARALGLI
jgi:hypothetical protein